MFKLFDNKNSDPMKVKKFYYYSPDKLKLIPIKNFIPKSILFLASFAIFITFTSFIIGSLIFDDSTSLILGKQNQIIEEGYEKEIDFLKNKYKDLAENYNELVQTSNDMRLVLNLEPLDLNTENYGIGGSDFDKDEYSTFIQGEKVKNIYEYVEEIETNLNFETSNYEEIQNKFAENIDLFNNLPAIRPVKSSIGDRFGMRFHPILKHRRMHYGLDFLSNTGEEVSSPGDGVVTYIGNKGGYGKVIRINHGFGYETIYAHLSKYNVKKGQKIKRGDVIALTGNSGSLSTGPHLHYEVRHNGVCLNPRNFIFEDVKLFEDSDSKILANR
ncbi:MAG: M23 family metallopeptidase [Ignavibacteriae bacterium]|nr:M23 family metallopeptidase [Ignavibacteriota bacterium]MCB9206794.1 M23 family metallopeptidase [Ignavibacteriales bacterium]MCB9210198.1 M23 family metallopeptidase [Ignavibacteriales bacterium]MCB9218417.1 M23 family metallopeptidase [Ignavibacteriales bacterium]MCB9259577.1 M23 family metallopeptidase [Ignavibacteriales bacterium]